MAAAKRPRAAERPDSIEASPPATAVVGIRDLRADVAALVRRAGAGEQLVISVAGHPTAHLGPLHSSEGHLRFEDLISKGHLIAPRRRGRYRAPDPVPVWQGSRIDKFLQDIR